MKNLKLVLKEFAGQYNDVEINIRDDNTGYVTFKMQKGFGYPSLEESELEFLLKKLKSLKE